MTEHELDAEVRRLLAEYGLYGYHSPDSRRSAAGWPDWVIVGDQIIYRELKSPRGVLSKEQTRVRNWLLFAEADYGVWRPRDLESGRIQGEMEAIA